MKISVITPTYNRKALLTNAYNSLTNQTNRSFEWIVVDDGSKDNTKDIMSEFINENKINIKYIEKENGGKHTAVNIGIDEAKGDLILILDSDDYLTDDAIETCINDWEKYCDNKKICGLSYNKKPINSKSEPKKLKESPYISNHIQCRYNEGYGADRAEVHRTDIMKEFKFPVYDGENFLSETILWNSIGKEYDTVYIDKDIYVCEYQSNGLTANSQKTRVSNPKGAIANYKIMMQSPFKLKLRIKYAILYNAFCNFAKLSLKERLKEMKKPVYTKVDASKTSGGGLVVVTKLLGDIVYLKWKKYLN